jgi:predicted DNA-binding protein (UPF0251 family)
MELTTNLVENDLINAFSVASLDEENFTEFELTPEEYEAEAIFEEERYQEEEAEYVQRKISRKTFRENWFEPRPFEDEDDITHLK